MHKNPLFFWKRVLKLAFNQILGKWAKSEQKLGLFAFKVGLSEFFR